MHCPELRKPSNKDVCSSTSVPQPVQTVAAASGLYPAEMNEEDVFMYNAEDAVNDGFYCAGVELLPM